jgi:hypothetical protein
VISNAEGSTATESASLWVVASAAGLLEDSGQAGVCRLMAFAFGLDPVSPDRSRLPVATVVDGRCQLGFIRPGTFSEAGTAAMAFGRLVLFVTIGGWFAAPHGAVCGALLAPLMRKCPRKSQRLLLTVARSEIVAVVVPVRPPQGLGIGWVRLAMPVSGFAGVEKVAIVPAAFGERARASGASPQNQDCKTQDERLEYLT